jgi:hypothetical protein
MSLEEDQNQIECLPLPVESKHFYMSWNQWTPKSNMISFKSITSGVGDGEDKVAHELETAVLGQNSSYDMKPIINGIALKCEVKKLDVQNDFNTAKEGRNALRPIKSYHYNLLESLRNLSESQDSIFPEEVKQLLQTLANINPDEMSVGTIRKLKESCEKLHLVRLKIIESLPTVQLSNPSGETFSMTLDVYYGMCETIGQPFPTEYVSFEPTIRILQHLKNRYIQEPHLFTDDLNNLVQFLNDVTLIIVDEQKGYMFIDISHVKFLRITRGNPRFQIVGM